MVLDPNLSTVIITHQQQQQHQQPYNYISLAQIERQVTSDNPGSNSPIRKTLVGFSLNFTF